MKVFLFPMFLIISMSVNAFFITNPTSSASARFSLDAQDILNVTVEGINPQINLANSSSNTNASLYGVADPVTNTSAINRQYLDSVVPPIGAVIPWYNIAGVALVLPTGFMLANGQVVNDPESPFNGRALPDLNNEQAVLSGAGNPPEIGQFVGSNNLALTTGNLPTHTHTINADAHSHTSSNTGNHRHQDGGKVWGRSNGALHSTESLGRGKTGYENDDWNAQEINDNSWVTLTSTTGAHAHTINSDSHSHTAQTAGASAPFDNRQSTMLITWIIRIK